MAFQFYDSPIKSVRGGLHPREWERFQFYDSPIKSSYASLRKAELECFNSMIVRLKEYADRGGGGKPSCFNSMIVRLKVNIHITVFASFMFQFYDSPIKSTARSKRAASNSLVSIL